MIEIDGALHSGSGSVVRQAVAYAAVTGLPVRVVNVRARRPNPGLRRQHAQAIQAICQLVGGSVQDALPGARAFSFHPSTATPAGRYTWDVGSAGSTTLLALAMLPLLATGTQPARVELRGGLFQDFAPSVFHLQHALLPLLARMGATVRAQMVRPGYVPSGGGILRLEVTPARGPLRPLLATRPGAVQRIWGIALSSYLAQRHVSARMAAAARHALEAAGRHARVDEVEDSSAPQPGAALALFADLDGGTRLGRTVRVRRGGRQRRSGRGWQSNCRRNWPAGPVWTGSSPTSCSRSPRWPQATAVCGSPSRPSTSAPACGWPRSFSRCRPGLRASC
jgi:RNA 3'-phosphate cyclase